jgi:hypothetical protein
MIKKKPADFLPLKKTTYYHKDGHEYFYAHRFHPALKHLKTFVLIKLLTNRRNHQKNQATHNFRHHHCKF